MEHARILIVESDGDAARSISEALLAIGHQPVAEVSVCADAVERSRALRPDLVLMSAGSGDESIATAARIRQELHIPVVFLCQPGDALQVAKAASLKASAMVLRPPDRSELACAIGAALLSRAAEAEMRARQSRGSFLGELNHVVRTPLHAVQGLTELMGDTKLDAHQLEYLASINSSVRTLVDNVDRLLDMVRVDEGDVDLDLAPMRIGELVDSVLGSFRDEAEAAGVTLASRTSSAPSWSLLGDAGRIRQVLLGLVANALKMTPEGEVRLEASCDNEAAGAMTTRVFFRVVDTGIGIPAERHENLFSERSSSPEVALDHGAAAAPDLGTCHALTELMGGQLRLESSTPGRGTVLCLEIDLRRGDNPAAPGPARSAEETNGEDSAAAFSARILVVEDDEESRRITVDMLEADGHRLDWAENGKVAAEKAMETAFDLILMDLEMPVCDGVVATRAIREFEAKRRQRRTPVVAISAHTRPEDKSRCLESGMDAHVPKPVQRETLREVLGKWIDPRPLVVVVDAAGDDKKIAERIIQSSRRFAWLSKASVEGALLTLRRESPAVAVLDLDAADAAALHLARAIKREFHYRVPILAIAGSQNADAERTSIEAGCDRFLHRPLLRREVLKIVADLADRARRAVAPQNGEPETQPKIVIEVDPDIADMVPEYLSNRRVEIHELGVLLEQRRYEKVKSLAHNLKGSAGAYGFNDLGAIAAQLEQAAKRENHGEIESALRSISDYLDRVELISS